MEQKIACEAIVEAIKKDNARKGSKKKKIDHWKKEACASLGIKKMGNARWTAILEYGYKNQHFKKDMYGDKEILSLVERAPILDFLSSEKPIVEEPKPPANEKRDSKGYKPSDYVSGNILKTSATRPRPIKENSHRANYAPREGDVMWAIYPDGKLVHVEIQEVSFGLHVVPMNKKDGHWSYLTSNDVFEDKDSAKNAQGERVISRDKKGIYWSKDAMGQEEYALFKEYEEHREEFKRFLESKSDEINEKS
jgi:hypothetical protein